MKINEMYDEFVRKPILEDIYNNPNCNLFEKLEKTIQFYLMDIIDEESLFISLLIYKELYEERNRRDIEKFNKRYCFGCKK